MLDLFVFGIDSLVHGDGEDGQVTLLVVEVVVVVGQDIIDNDRTFQFQECKESIVDFLFDNFFGRFSLISSLAATAGLGLGVLLLLVVDSLAVVEGHLRLLAVAAAVFLHVARLFLHVLVHHVVRERHRPLGVLRRLRHDVVVAVASGTA